MFCLRCQKYKENGIYYIWANKDNLREWCLSEVPCLFENYTEIITLKNIIEESSSDLKNIVIIQNNKFLPNR